MAICPNCGSQQPDGAAFCDECGAKLEAAIAPALPPAGLPPASAMAQPPPTVVAANCRVCGTPVTPGEPFCSNCGAALGPSAPFPPAPAAVPVPPPAAAASAPTMAAGLVCAQCGAQLEPGSNFCDVCGAPAGAPKPPAPTPPPPSAPTISPPPFATPPPPPMPASTPPAQPPPQPSMPGRGRPTPVHPPVAALHGRMVVQGTNTNLPFPPGKTEIIIGREDPISSIFPEIDLTDHGGDEGGVSRRHARVFAQGSQIVIEDLNSTNYTYVNQQKLTPGQPHPLNDGDDVRLGRVKLNFYST